MAVAHLARLIQHAMCLYRVCTLRENVVETGRPNHNMTDLVGTAIDIATKQSRLAAVRFLFDRGCAPEMIAHILAACATGQGPTTRYSIR